MELTKGSVYAVRADGAELIFDSVDDDGFPYGYLRQKNGKTSTIGLFDKWQKVGNWTVVQPFIKHMSGQHDQSSHGNWAKRPYIGHEFTDTDGVKVTVQFHNLKQKLTEKQKKEFLTIIYDLKKKTDLTGLDEVKVSISDYDPDFNNDKSQRGNTQTLFDEDTNKLISEINIRGEDLLRTTFTTREQNAWMKRSTNGTVASVAEYLMAHEWGHVISHHRETTFIVGRSDMAMARRKNFVHDLLWQNKNDLSGYGRTSYGEGYAEAYADWFMNDGKNSPAWMDELAKVDSWQK